AMGIALGVQQSSAKDAAALERELSEICTVIGATRPTAVNLFWAMERMKRRFTELRAGGFAEIRPGLIREAQQVLLEDIACCEAIGRNGAALVPSAGSIMTHCNAGALATGGYGTALGVVRAAHEINPNLHVFSCETRPVLQGARLTVWELQQ